MGQLLRGKVSNDEPRSDAPMRVREVAVYRGPHLFSRTKMIRIQLDLGALEYYPSDRIAGFTERLLQMLPGLRQHHCSLGRPGGFVKRLQEGTWLGHVVEHVALDLQALIGVRGANRGKTRSLKDAAGDYIQGVYNVMYAYKDEETGRMAGRIALELVASLASATLENAQDVHPVELPARFDLEACLKKLRRTYLASKLGPTTNALVEEAERRGIPWQRLDDSSMIQLGTGIRQKRIRASISSNTSMIAVDAAGNKDLTKKLLDDVGLPVPQGGLARTVEEAQRIAARIGFPVTIKPLDANHGRGVSTDLCDDAGVACAFAHAAQHSRSVIVEQHYPGRDHRILVVDGKVVAVAERVPAQVTGNGKDTIRALIGQVNEDPRRGDGHEEVMTRIRMDKCMEDYLARSGLSFYSVPEAGREVQLSAAANLSAGGTAIDRTDAIHPDNLRAAERAARTIGLDIAGIDMVIPDIGRSWRELGGGIVEVNAAPGFRMHLHPAQGQSRNVAKPVLSMLLPNARKAQVPLIAITGTNGKSTTVRMVVQMLRSTGASVGFTSTSGIYINDECLWQGDASGPRSAKRLLRDATIDYAVLETARGGILREGLGFQECDVGALLNISEDHLGLGGIHTLEDLAAVKGVVVEATRKQGVSVLNADDPLTRDMAKIAGGSICFFSMQGPEAVAEHIAKGGLALTREGVPGGEEIVFYQIGQRTRLMAVAEIPATYNGAVRFNVENALAAAAIGFGLGLEPPQIRAGLSGFHCSFDLNPGRLNVHDEHGFRVVLDYAHNPAALRAVLGVIRAMREDYGRVIGTVSTPGDRRDEDIREVGAIAAHDFDLLVFRELPDNRGRPPGETVRLVREGAIAAGCPEDRILGVPSEEEATDICLRAAMPGDLVLVLPTKVEAIWRRIVDFRPEFVSPPHQHLRHEAEKALHV